MELEEIKALIIRGITKCTTAEQLASYIKLTQLIYGNPVEFNLENQD